MRPPRRLLWKLLRWPFALALALRDWWAVARVFAESRDFQNAWCRMRGHPNGMIYYNPGGTAPDGRCKDCGEDIG